MAEIDTVIFDWDGTIVDTFPIALRVFQEIIGSGFTEEDLRRNFGSGVRAVIEDFFKTREISYTTEEAERLKNVKLRRQNELAHEVRFLPGTLELFELLNGKAKLGICSSNYLPMIVPVLHGKKLLDCFDKIITADNTYAKKMKPFPDIFLHAAEALGAAPESCIAFEDSPMGVESAKGAGMFTIAVCTGPFSQKELSEKNPDIIVENLESPDISNLLKQL
jgi:HAD superfamily hydrolase (TIGR01509 family)